MRKKVLVIEDDADIVQLLKYHFEADGFHVLVAKEGEEGFLKARKEKPQLIVLDLMLPHVSGLDICRMLKSEQETQHMPVIILTAKTEEVDRVVGFELGADDYVTKPFSPRELLLRAKAILKRVEAHDAPEAKEEVVLRDLYINIPRREVKIKNKEISLTKIEFDLLLALAQAKGRVQTREHLLSSVWGYETEVDTRTIDTHMRRLRSKLGVYAKQIETRRGVGYCFQYV